MMDTVGVTGITLACQVKETAPNVDVVVYDQADAVGGNWYWNRYGALFGNSIRTHIDEFSTAILGWLATML